MGKISANDTSTVRYISESPAPLKKARHCIDVDAIDSPSVVRFFCFLEKIVCNKWFCRKNE